MHRASDRIECVQSQPLPQRFMRDEEGNFALIAALLLPLLVGSAALAVEYGHGLVTRSHNQRVGDMSAFSGALRYTDSQSEAEMRAAARQVARLNGIAPDKVDVALVPAPRGEGEAVRVTISVENSIVLGTLLGASDILKISTLSYAAIGSEGEGSCILALDAQQSGVILSGGTSLSATTCSVASNATIEVPCGTSIVAELVYYDSKPPSQGCNGIRSPDGSAGKSERQATPDPLAGNAQIGTAVSRLTAVAGMPAVTIPSVKSGPDIEFGWNNRQPVAAKLSQAGCSLGPGADYSGEWIVICPDATAVHNFGTLTVTGKSLQFNAGGKASKRYEFSGGINVTSGAKASFPDGTYVVTRGISASSGTEVSFGKGSFHVGANTNPCAWDSSTHSICAASSLTFAGPSSFTLVAGFYNGGGSTLLLGSGEDNFFDLGTAGNGNSIMLSGGAQTIMGNATVRANAFRLRGNFNGGGGGSCTVVSAAPHHDINGSVMLAGGVILGKGIYTVNGAFLLGAAGGGGAPCQGRMVSVEAEDVTVVISGKTVGTSGSCVGTAFCIAAGYNNVVFRAPKTGPTAGLAVIGPIDGKVAGATLAEGAGNARISGAFYFPTGPIVMGGSAGVAGGGGDCLQLIGSRITLSGGANAASDCLSSGVGGTKKKVALIR
jgi:hypothetical protein